MKCMIFGAVLAVVALALGDTLAWAWDASDRTVDGAVEGTTAGQALDAGGQVAESGSATTVEARWETSRESAGIAFDSRAPQGMYLILR